MLRKANKKFSLFLCEISAVYKSDSKIIAERNIINEVRASADITKFCEKAKFGLKVFVANNYHTATLAHCQIHSSITICRKCMQHGVEEHTILLQVCLYKAHKKYFTIQNDAIQRNFYENAWNRNLRKILPLESRFSRKLIRILKGNGKVFPQNLYPGLY